MTLFCFFFFSSRRRHTRCSRDWSSDVCSSDLGQTFEIILEGALAGAGYTLWPQVASTTLTLLRVPLAAWWSSAIGLVGIWLALCVTAVARGIVMAIFWLSGAWRRATV